MRIIEIAKNRLYRVYKDDNYKDVWIANGEILYPENPHNILTPTECQAIEMEIF